MFDKIGNMPLHPLVTHAAVVGVPLAFLLAVLFAVPRTRNWARWPLALTAAGAAVVTWVSKESGEAFERSQGLKPGNPVYELIERHSHLADQLFLIMVAFAVVAVANAVVVNKTRRGPVAVVLVLALLAVAVVAAVWVVRVGDLGARAVWNPTGQA